MNNKVFIEINDSDSIPSKILDDVQEQSYALVNVYKTKNYNDVMFSCTTHYDIGCSYVKHLYMFYVVDQEANKVVNYSSEIVNSVLDKVNKAYKCMVQVKGVTAMAWSGVGSESAFELMVERVCRGIHSSNALWSVFPNESDLESVIKCVKGVEQLRMLYIYKKQDEIENNIAIFRRQISEIQEKITTLTNVLNTFYEDCADAENLLEEKGYDFNNVSDKLKSITT